MPFSLGCKVDLKTLKSVFYEQQMVKNQIFKIENGVYTFGELQEFKEGEGSFFLQ